MTSLSDEKKKGPKLKRNFETPSNFTPPVFTSHSDLEVEVGVSFDHMVNRNVPRMEID